METMETQVEKMEKQLERWNSKLKELVVKVDQAGAQATIEYRNSIDDLKSKHQMARAKLNELKTASGDTWAAFKTGVENAWDELETGFKNLTSYPLERKSPDENTPTS